MSNAPAVQHLRVGWSAYGELGDPLAALAGWLLRLEMARRLPGLTPVLCLGQPLSWDAPGFTGEAALQPHGGDGEGPNLDILVMSGEAGPQSGGLAEPAAGAGRATVAVATRPSWPVSPRLCVGPPFSVPEPVLLAARHLPASTLTARAAYLRVVHGLPHRYVLVDQVLLRPQAHGEAAGPASVGRHNRQGRPAGRDEGLGGALAELAQLCARQDEGPRVEVVELAPGPLRVDDPEAEAVLRESRGEAEEGRHQPEDWAGREPHPPLALPVASPLDLAAAVAGAQAVVAGSGPLLALAWSLGVPHVALAQEGPAQVAAAEAADAFVAWTGDATAVAADPAQLSATIGHVLARRGEPPGLKRLEATVDQSLDEAATTLRERADELVEAGRAPSSPSVAAAERAQELQAVNQALRQRLAAERLLFAQRAALLERTAHTTVESAVKAVQGQDLVTRKRLEAALKEMKRLQDETAQQQAELRAIHNTLTWRALAPARQWYSRLRQAGR